MAMYSTAGMRPAAHPLLQRSTKRLASVLAIAPWDLSPRVPFRVARAAAWIGASTAPRFSTDCCRPLVGGAAENLIALLAHVVRGIRAKPAGAFASKDGQEPWRASQRACLRRRSCCSPLPALGGIGAQLPVMSASHAL